MAVKEGTAEVLLAAERGNILSQSYCSMYCHTVAIHVIQESIMLHSLSMRAKTSDAGATVGQEGRRGTQGFPDSQILQG